MNLKVQKKSIFPLEFEKSKNCQNDHRVLNLDVTFCSDTFSYKKLFNPTSYAKVIAVLLWHDIFLQNILKFKFFIFVITRTHNIWKSQSFLFF
jgi:hypothetical protein